MLANVGIGRATQPQVRVLDGRAAVELPCGCMMISQQEVVYPHGEVVDLKTHDRYLAEFERLRRLPVEDVSGLPLFGEVG